MGQDIHHGHKYVDLGLSVKWATCNVGASQPEEYGGYYQWAGLMDISDDSVQHGYNNCPYHCGSDEQKGWTKYVPSNNPSYWSGTGSPDNKTSLSLEDDIANVAWGGHWRTPTMDEWLELVDECSWEWTTIKETKGYKIYSQKWGYTDKWIFLPEAGFKELRVSYAGDSGYYWSSSINKDYPSHAAYIRFEVFHIYTMFYFQRCNGLSVRPVIE